MSIQDGVLCWDAPRFGNPTSYILTYWDREAGPTDPRKVTTSGTCGTVSLLTASHSYVANVVAVNTTGRSGPFSRELVFLSSNSRE